MTPATALDRLRAGNIRFVSNAPRQRDWSANAVAAASAQLPFAAVLACTDSRAPIEVLFDQGPGDVVGVRVAGNTVNDDELGSLEYAARWAVDRGAGHTCRRGQGRWTASSWNLTGLLDRIHPPSTAGCKNAKDEACVDRGRAERAPVDQGDPRGSATSPSGSTRAGSATAPGVTSRRAG
jgi:carbonic anhydrase